MRIVHYLTKQNNFSHFLNCPICGNDFKNQHKMRAIEDAKNRIKLIEDKSEVVNDELNTEKIFDMSCSKCSFEVEYHLPIAILNIEPVNNLLEDNMIYLN